jgi:hypothetical protein
MSLLVVLDVVKAAALIALGCYLLILSLKEPRPDWIRGNEIKLFAVAVSLIILGILVLA